MINVLVIEDEPPILRATVAMIEASNFEFKVVATAINGKRAIEELKKQKIDVVFTDIKMPFMDGLEIAKYIRDNYPDIITIITSGYSDFEYARQGISYKVMDYILKPMSKVKLTEVLMKISEEIDKKKHIRKKEMLFKKVDNYDSEMIDSTWLVILICAGSIPIYGNDTMVPAVAFWDNLNLENAISCILKDYEYIISRGHTMAEQVIAIEQIKTKDYESIPSKIFDFANNEEITITLNYRIGVKISDISKVIADLHDEMDENIILTKSQIFNEGKTEEVRNEFEDLKKYIELIGKFLKKGDRVTVINVISKVFEMMEKEDATQAQVISFFDMIINYCYFNGGLNKKNISTIKKELYETLNNFTDYKSNAEDVTSVLINIFETKKKFYNKEPKFIEEIKKYLEENYQRSITNNVLSKQFGFVPSYISRIFRQYNNGVSPGEYLINFRIDKAKQIMEEQSDLLVKEIAEMVGFQDAYYFSKIFKKKTGVWPTEYY